MQLAQSAVGQKLGQSRFGQRLLVLLRIIILLQKTFREKKITVLAQSLAYTTIFTLVPVLAIFFAVLGRITQNTAVQTQFKNFISEYINPQYAQSLFVILENLSTGSFIFGAIGFPTLFLTGVFLYVKVDSSINEIWMSNKETQWFKNGLAFFMTLFFGPMILVLVFSIPPYLQNLPFIKEVIEQTGLGALFTKLIPFLVLVLGLSVLYMYIPTVHVKFGAALRGAILAGAIILVANILLTTYINTFSRFDVFYGSLATMIILLLYVFVFWMVVLTGAVLSFIHHYHKDSGYLNVQGFYNDESVLCSALSVMTYLVQCFTSRNESPDFEQIQLMLGINRSRLTYILDALKREKLVTSFQEGRNKRNPLVRYQPGQSPDQVLLSDLVQMFSHPRDHVVFQHEINYILNSLEVHPGFKRDQISVWQLLREPDLVKKIILTANEQSLLIDDREEQQTPV